MSLPRAPRAIFRAFVRGRHSANLLDRPLDDVLLERTLDDVRGELGLAAGPPPATAADRLVFAAWSGLALAIVWGPLPLLAALAWQLR